MKIFATKKELATMVRVCSQDCSCPSCILYDFCGNDNDVFIEDFVEIEEGKVEKEKQKSTPK